MTLHQWLKANQTSDEEFALSVSDVTAHAVRKWRYGERRPRYAVMVRIEALTLGAVSMRDWDAVSSAPAIAA